MADGAPDIYDAMDAHPGRVLCCPKCGDSDVKFAIHDPGRYGFTLSVSCRDCRCDTETAKDGEHEALFLRWSACPAQSTKQEAP